MSNAPQYQPVFTDGRTVTEWTGKTDPVTYKKVPTSRVVTLVEGKEGDVIYRTHHNNPDIKSLYEGYKTADNKSEWIVQNRLLLAKFDINIDRISR